jgi:glycosyltransferase involved in cell wall biosynthesis
VKADREDSIAACLIAKDAIDTIELCIRSIRPFVDEINVFDTGSSDGTLEFLSRAAATRAVGDAEIRVVRGEWRDDFAWARQQSAAMASPNATWLY